MKQVHIPVKKENFVTQLNPCGLSPCSRQATRPQPGRHPCYSLNRPQNGQADALTPRTTKQAGLHL